LFPTCSQWVPMCVFPNYVMGFNIHLLPIVAGDRLVTGQVAGQKCGSLRWHIPRRTGWNSGPGKRPGSALHALLRARTLLRLRLRVLREDSYTFFALTDLVVTKSSFKCIDWISVFFLLFWRDLVRVSCLRVFPFFKVRQTKSQHHHHLLLLLLHLFSQSLRIIHIRACKQKDLNRLTLLTAAQNCGTRRRSDESTGICFVWS